MDDIAFACASPPDFLAAQFLRLQTPASQEERQKDSENRPTYLQSIEFIQLSRFRSSEIL